MTMKVIVKTKEKMIMQVKIKVKRGIIKKKTPMKKLKKKRKKKMVNHLKVNQRKKIVQKEKKMMTMRKKRLLY